MKIQLAEHYGLCFGVRDAIAEAERLARQGPLTILGELVHNPVIRERLAAQGVREGTLGALNEPVTPQVMITAHGTSDLMRNAWRRSGRGVADGTCPLVRHAHEQLKALVQLGYFPVVIGQHGHIEVEGLIGDFPNAWVVGSEQDLPSLPYHDRFGVISQTTQPIEKVRALVASLQGRHPESEVRFCDTVCQPTKNRQAALKKLIADCDTIVVVGGKNSNNTLQLVAAATAAGRMAFHITQASELELEWFRHSEIVGITAGTSTLKETVAAVHERLERFAEAIHLLETKQTVRSTIARATEREAY